MAAEPTTLNELFNHAVQRFRDREMLQYKSDGGWRSLSYGDVARRVRELALGLHRLGVRRGDRVGIWSENRPEWNIADLAALATGAVDVPVYTTQSLPQVELILRDSGAVALFVSGSKLAEALEIKRKVESLQWIICFDAAPEETGVISTSGLVGEGREVYGGEPGLYERLWREARADDLATLLYTSGTTGDPKGVMLTHRNLTANALYGQRWLEIEDGRDRALTYLPFSHIFERAVWYLYAHTCISIAYAESVDTVAQNLAEVRPTIMTSVPRMFEKIYGKIMDRGVAAGFPRKQVFLWSMDVGHDWAARVNRGEPVGLALALKHKVADALVFKKWREAVGGRVRLFISGGAPLAPEIAYLFLAAEMPILQGYGLTETSPTISANTEKRNRIGTVGRVLDHLQLRFDEDGEILVKGDTVMQGYYNRPAENALAFTEDGWFRTGDIGYMDPDGFLVITDRKKELIKTSGGKFIAPQQVESLIKSSRFVSQVVVVGEGRRFAAALIVPNMEMLRSYAQTKAIAYADESELLTHPRILDLMHRQVDKFTGELARYEKVKKVALLGRELTTDSGELTPTLKPRRKVIESKYAPLIDGLYEESTRAVTV